MKIDTQAMIIGSIIIVLLIVACSNGWQALRNQDLWAKHTCEHLGGTYKSGTCTDLPHKNEESQ